MYSVFLIKPRC